MSSRAVEGVSTSGTASPQSVPGLTARVATRPPRAGRSMRYLSLEDFAAHARRRLPRMLYGFIAGSSESGASARDNRSSFARYALLPRVLVDTGSRTTATTLFGRRYAAPFGIAPLGAAALCAYRGDIELARGAVLADIPMILSATSLIPLEQVRQAGAQWYQAYLPASTHWC